MRRSPRDSEGVASTVATLFSLLILLVFLQAALVAPIPARQYDAEWQTSTAAVAAFRQLRSTLATLAPAGTTFTVPMPMGTDAVSVFAASSPGTLSFRGDQGTARISFRFVPQFYNADVRKIDQDVVLLMDSSGSMVWNDPQRLRISGAKEYVDRLIYPDRVAIVDFDSDALLTKMNAGGSPHHLNTPGHDGIPNHAEAKTDLDTIDSSGGTNFGDAIRIANDELAAYGNPNHAWVEILLTDGENNAQWMDDRARAESLRARALGITIYTIGLGSAPDAALLTEIATNTGGTYYAAPNAQSIRWIYLEISRRYQSAFSCGIYASSDVSMGVLSLDLLNQEYPRQSVRLEAGGISVVQRDGSVILDGMPSKYVATGSGAGALTLSILSLTGATASTSGTWAETVSVRTITRETVDQKILKVRLDEEADAIANITRTLDDWASQGAATPSAQQAVGTLLDDAEAFTRRAHGNATAGDIPGAKFDVDRAQARLSAAATEAERQASLRQMQSWLAAMLRDMVLASGCRLEQWRNWYDGISITLESPAATLWARWFNETFRAEGALVSAGVSGDRAVISLHAIDRFVLEYRLAEITIGGAPWGGSHLP